MKLRARKAVEEVSPDSRNDAHAERFAGFEKVAKEFEAFAPASEALVNVRAVPTIFPYFDFRTRVGGLPIERFTLLHGSSGGGKTFFAIGLMLSFLMRGHPVFFIDAERCYDPETEVLTRRGFVHWPDVTDTDLIGMWDPDQQSLVYEKPYEITRQRYKGQMRRIDHGGVDLLVTPKHKMYVKTKIDRGSRDRGEREIGWNDWKLIPADELGDRMTVKYRKHAARTVATEFESNAGCPVFPKHDDRLALLRMIGFFIGDGWVGKARGRTNAIAFGLTKPRKIAYLREVAAELGWPVRQMSNGVYVVDAEAVGSLFRKEFYDDNDQKRIPEYLLDLNADEAEAMLDGLRASDGSLKRGAWEYSTTSNQVAEAVQRLVIHAGGSAHIHRSEVEHAQHRTMNRVMVLSRMLEPVINSHHTATNTSLVDYDGEIFCAHTRTGIMMIRRNGKPVLSGNTTPIAWLRKAMGPYAHHPLFRAVKPSTYEQTRDDVRAFCNKVKRLRIEKSLPPDTSGLIVLDSLKKLVPKDQFDMIAKEKTDKKQGARSRIDQHKAGMNAAWLDELVILLDETKTAMVAIARETIDPNVTDQWAIKLGYNVRTGGGVAPFYDASLDLRSRLVKPYGKKVKGPDGKDRVTPYGDLHEIAITKSKVSGKGEVYRAKATYHISNGVWVPEGFDRARDLIAVARMLDVVSGTGWLTFGRTRWRSEDLAVRALTSDSDLFAKVDTATRACFKMEETRAL